MEAFFARSVGGVTAKELAIAACVLLAAFTAARFVERGLAGLSLRAPDGSLRRAVVGAFDRPTGWLFRLAGIWFALQSIRVEVVAEANLSLLINRLFQAVSVALATWLGVRVVSRACEVWAERAAQTEGTFDDQLVPIVRKAAIAFLVIVGAVMIVQNLGYSASSLLAGFGIGGAAVAFASKDTVANFFGSIVVFVDRPFQIGDWVEVGEVEGTVETVGIRVTRIRTFANALITIPNATFTTSAINNWSRMRKRRIKMTIGLTYDTTPDRMRQAIEAIRALIRSDDRLHQDFFLVNFYDFGPSSLDIFCYLFTRTTNWAEHMQIREEFMLRVMEAMRGLELSFAFPTRSVYLPGASSMEDAATAASAAAAKAPDQTRAEPASRDVPL